MSAHVIERVVRRNSSPDGHVIRSVTTGPSIVLNGSGMPAASDAEAIAATLTNRALTPASASARDVVVYAAKYGALGGGVANEAAELQDAIDAAEALVGASSLDIRACVELGLGKHYKVNANVVVVPKGVYFHMNGSKIQALTAGTIVKLEGYQSGIEHGTIFGVGGVTDNLGIHMSAASGGGRQAVRNVTFDALGGRAILCEAIASWISDVVAQGCLTLDSALASPTGVCELNTTDCWVTNSEFTASNTAMSASGNAYAVVVKGGTHQLQGVIAEISDGGFWISATRSRYSVCRADLNRGHGWTFVTGAGGQVVGCSSLRNGLETTNTYDGFHSEIDTRLQFSTNTAESLTADAKFHRYGFFDATQGYANYNQYDSTNVSILAATAPIKVEDVAGAKVTCADGPFISAAAAATTIDVQQYGWPMTRWRLLSVAPVNFTDFTNHVTGMRISVIGDGFTTFVHNASVLRLRAGINQLAAAGRIYEFVNNSGIWYEASPDAPSAWELFGEYTTAGTTAGIVLPVDTVAALVHMTGGGAGGGSGRRGAAASVRCGGGGGAGGGQYSLELRGTVLTETLTVIVGAGGAGGAAVTADDTSGNVGTAGGNTSITGSVSGAIGFCYGGFTAGGGGTAAAGAAGVGIISDGPAPGGGAASGTGAAGGGATSLGRGPTGGGAGGGISAADAASAGGAGGTAFALNAGAAGGAIATVGGTVNGTQPNTQQRRNHVSGGPGGGGGGSSIVGVAGTGGAGAVPGGAGGGGGASLNTNNSGAGGAGAAGQVLIWILRS